LRYLPDAESLAAANLYMNHNSTFDNVKRNLLNINQGISYLGAPLKKNPASECDYSEFDDVEDKLDLDLNEDDFDKVSNFGDEYER